MLEDLKAPNKAAEILIAEALRVKEQRDELLKALEDLLASADKMIYRPPLDDTRQLDRDTMNLRRQLEPARAAIKKAKGL